MSNVWAINRDPEMWGQDACHFNPGRHLDPATGKGQSHITFGFGRRKCPGEHIANDFLFIFISTVLWALNIERDKGEDGEEAPINLDGCRDEGLIV